METVHQHQQQQSSDHVTYQQPTPIYRAAIATSSLAIAPRIDRTAVGQALVRCDEPCSIAVDVTGYPAPEVTWHIGRRRIRDSAKYRTTIEGHRHTLIVPKVTVSLEKGVWIRASNEVGEDNCIIPVKTYKVFSGLRFSFEDGNVRQTACAPDVVLHRSATTRSQLRRPASSLCSEDNDNESAMSVPYAVGAVQDDWQREMALRNRMRSVDDLQQYKVWKMSDSSQSIDNGDGTHSTGTGRRLRKVYVRRNRSVDNVTDQSSLDGDTCDGGERSSRRRERRHRTMTDTTRSQSAAALTVGVTSGQVAVRVPSSADATSLPTGRSSSTDRRRRSSSTGRRRDGGQSTGSVADGTTSKRGRSTSHIDPSADDSDSKCRTVNNRSTRSSLGVTSPNAASVNVEARLQRPPTGRSSHFDRSTKTSKITSAAVEVGSSSIKHRQNTPLSSSNGAHRDGGDGVEQLEAATQNDDDVWKLFGVRLGTLVHTLLVSREMDESNHDGNVTSARCSPMKISSMENTDRHAARLIRSASNVSQIRAVDAAVLTLEQDRPVTNNGRDGQSSLPQINHDDENPRHSVKLEYKYTASVAEESVSVGVDDGSTVISGTASLDIDRADQCLTENNTNHVETPICVESRTDVCLPDNIDSVIDDGACADSGISILDKYEHGEMINCPRDARDNDSLADRFVSWHPKNVDPSDINSIQAILSQTVDLQKILCTIDQLVGVNGVKFHAVDQHQPTLEPPLNTANGRPEVLDSTDGRRVVPTTVVKRGGIRVHSDGEDEELDMDTESFYNDAGLSATVDLGGPMAAADTDNDDDDFDSAEYERDSEVHDIGVHPGKTSKSTLTISDRFG